MGPRLPNVFIYLAAIVRPSRLRPDLKVKTIGHVDFAALRKAGYNAVVVDKDNCVTLPEQDGCYPPFKEAWRELLTAFEPGRVLVVSNSAGTKKDPSGIAARSVSHHLQTPVLIHAQPKPGCADEILKYFRGELGAPVSIIRQKLALIQADQDAFQAECEAILKRGEKEWMSKEIARIRSTTSDTPTAPSSTLRTAITLPESLEKRTSNPDANLGSQTLIRAQPTSLEEARILVIGDRQFTDTLLAHRLRLLLPNTSSDFPSVISIHTTLLPQPRDVPVLRWLEEKLSRGQLRDPSNPWKRYTRRLGDEEAHENAIEVGPKMGYLASRWSNVKQTVKDSRMGWDPRQWTVKSVIIGIGKGIFWTGRGLGVGMSRTGRYVWVNGRQWQARRRERLRLAKEKAAEAADLTSGERQISAKESGDTQRIEHKAVPMIASAEADSGHRPSAVVTPSA
ncbi:mitochondrial PGP phosphatase-domain-containing protein [Kockovaella imperatae]|uniref:Mitochondrial PGP phosphatase-domain-containing protein n=1 Tax=Kockovaella imperatae TaxID=4999 RepID=A0A1Y1U8G2_9TREE|nr:mitochondrial PGP phosphatase-domain-containing protein [Kockovaella imperatae]ORX34302.1 mitochondrial PGP phosphatase-domain-containing protein [Kockovaella imperatae]